MTFKLNDVVELNPKSRWVRATADAMNPTSVRGKVIEVDRKTFSNLNLRVEWDNGRKNSYNEVDLILIESAEDPAVAISKTKLKFKRYTDDAGDSFKVDTVYSPSHVTFEPKGEKEIVALTVEQVIDLRKQLKHWLVANGHNKGE